MSRTPDIETTMKMYAVYQQGKPCYAVAKIFGVKRQCVWDRFKRRGLKMRPSSRHKALPFIEFDGHHYAPEKDGYFRKTVGDRELLHHAIWIKKNGPLTHGWVVIFVDKDRMNVTIDNLESVPKNESQRCQDIKVKPCLACDRLMGRRATGSVPESPSAYAKRKTCNTQCSAAWKKGRPRGSRMSNRYSAERRVK